MNKNEQYFSINTFIDSEDPLLQIFWFCVSRLREENDGEKEEEEEEKEEEEEEDDDIEAK